MELKYVENDLRWDQLLARQPGATLFHTISWLRFQEAHFDHRLIPLVACHNGVEVGLFPLFVTRRWLIRVAGSPRGIDTLHLGPLVADELLADLLDAYEQWARANRIGFSTIAFTREIDLSSAESRGFTCERHRFSVVDLTGGEKEAYRRLGSDCRRRIRQADNRGVKIIEGDFSEHYDRYLKLSSMVFARSNLKTQMTRSILAGMIDTLRRDGRLLAIRAEVDGKVAGMWIGGHYGKTMVALDIVSDRAFIDCSVNNRMSWHAIQWCCHHGLEAFDFGGSRIPSLRRFKASFGATEYFYHNIKRAHGPLARAAVRLAYQLQSGLRTWLFRRSQKGHVQMNPPSSSAKD
jgi:CelD/BcsL family acetyltransferase involved in cellulose biosynthesis